MDISSPVVPAPNEFATIPTAVLERPHSAASPRLSVYRVPVPSTRGLVQPSDRSVCIDP